MTRHDLRIAFAGFLTALFVGVSASQMCCAPGMHAARPRAPDEQVPLRIESSCMVEDPFAGGFPFVASVLGSGSAIDHHRVLTAEHVVGTFDDAGNIVQCPAIPDLHIVFPDGRRIRAYPEYEDPVHDVAILRTVEDTGQDPVAFAPPVVGEVVCTAVAVPAIEHNCGPVTSLGGDDGEEMRAELRGQHGNSGGAAYDSRGRIVGILTEGPHDGLEGIGFATGIPPLADVAGH